VQQAGGVPIEESANTEQFLDDGRTVYLWLVGEMHGGAKRRRKQRKETDRWLDFSKESQEKIKNYARSEGGPDPFDLPLPSPQEVGTWVDEGTLPSVELTDEN
jgi:hypothetical protein